MPSHSKIAFTYSLYQKLVRKCYWPRVHGADAARTQVFMEKGRHSLHFPTGHLWSPCGSWEEMKCVYPGPIWFRQWLPPNTALSAGTSVTFTRACHRSKEWEPDVSFACSGPRELAVSPVLVYPQCCPHLLRVVWRRTRGKIWKAPSTVPDGQAV